MLIENNKNLKFQCGPYGLLIDIEHISAIEDNNKYQHMTSKNSAGKYSDTVLWNDLELLFIDLRIALDIKKSEIQPALHVLVLKDIATDKPFVMVAVDEVHHIVEIHESQWYDLNGISPRLDSFFDRACPDNESRQILMRLAPAKQWAIRIAGVTNAN
jgi:hypothetical protein